MTKPRIDLDKLRVQLRRLRKDALLELLDRAIGLLPGTRLPALVQGYVQLEALRPDGATRGGLLQSVVSFREASLRGEYYEDFAVNSKNFMKPSRGTETWISECERLFGRCAAEAGRRPAGEVREAFDVLFDLLRHIDEGHDDVVFFADEGGSYEVFVDWEKVLPTYFAALSGTATPEEYAGVVSGLIRDFVHDDRDRCLRAARAAGTPGQRAVLRQSWS